MRKICVLLGMMCVVTLSLCAEVPNKASAERVEVAETPAVPQSAMVEKQRNNTVVVSEDPTLDEDLWDMLCRTFPVLRAHPILAYLIPAGLLLLFILLVPLMRAMIRVR